MNKREDGSDQKGWLSLSLGPYVGETSSKSKVYTCNFCNKKFYNSQALGGHQNGHKRERDAARRYYSQNTSDMTMSSNQSLGVQAHSLVHMTPTRNGEATVARFTNHGTQYGVQPNDGEEEAEMKWAGGFYFEAQPTASDKPSDQHKLDLNLRL